MFQWLVFRLHAPMARQADITLVGRAIPPWKYIGTCDKFICELGRFDALTVRGPGQMFVLRRATDAWDQAGFVVALRNEFFLAYSSIFIIENDTCLSNQT